MGINYNPSKWENGKTVIKASHFEKIEKGITDIINYNNSIYIDEDRRKIQFELDNLRATRKTESNKIGAMKKDGIDTTELQAQIRKMGDDIKTLEEKLTELDSAQKEALLFIPNTPDCDTWRSGIVI